jgi:hypothetical protein
VWSEKLGPVPARVVNNLLVGPGQLEGARGEIGEGNRRGRLRDPAALDFRPVRGTGPVRPPPAALAPAAEPAPPLGRRALTPPRRWLPGALQDKPALRPAGALP